VVSLCVDIVDFQRCAEHNFLEYLASYACGGRFVIEYLIPVSTPRSDLTCSNDALAEPLGYT
jgi:hypothetical protein